MKTTSFLWISLLALLLFGLAAPNPAAAEVTDFPVYLPAIARQPALPPPDAASARISLPPGFQLRIFATFSSGPRLMTVGPDGMLYAALSGGGQVVRLPDLNLDGLVDQVQVVASGLTYPHNVEWRDGWMWVGEPSQVSRLQDTNGDGFYETKQVIVSGLPVGSHNSRTIHFGPDGKLYVAVGSSCNVCIETDPRRAALLRYNLDGSIPADNPFVSDPDVRKQAVYASGLRNVVDFVWTPGGELWASSHGSDNLGDDAPPEEIIIRVEAGGFYGWPYCYTPSLGVNVPQQPEVNDTVHVPNPLPAGFNCATAIPAHLTLPAHSAPIGMTRAAGSHFPPGYEDDLFVGLHGSWNTTPASYRDCKVERILVEAGQVVGSETFATGWREPGKRCGDPTTYGRPAGVIIGPEGALFIADDHGKRIYRVIYTGP
jgi:glucose/arabinose dehydrogenase